MIWLAIYLALGICMAAYCYRKNKTTLFGDLFCITCWPVFLLFFALVKHRYKKNLCGRCSCSLENNLHPKSKRLCVDCYESWV